MNRETRKAAVIFTVLCALAVVSWASFRGYLTPDMMIYALSLKWCF